MSSLFPTSMAGATVQPGTSVSIVMRTKDRPVLLARAFASVLNQTHQDWHLYLVNDGGNPNSVNELCAQYAGGFGERLTVIHHETSKGMEAAANAALAASREEFVAVHDDDDAWHPLFLMRTIAFLNDPANATCVAVAAKCVIAKERVNDNSVIEEGREDWVVWRDLIDFGSMLTHNIAPPISLLIRRSAVDVAGKFNTSLPALGDWDYNLRIMLVGDIGTINDVLCSYHMRASSDERDEYKNYVLFGMSGKNAYYTRYANSLLRPLLQESPGYLGLAHMLLKQMFHHQNELRWQYHQLEGKIAGLNSTTRLEESVVRLDATLHTVEKILCMPRSAWRKLYPIRRLIAKMRGRV